MSNPLKQGAVIGILGGGQLGRMLSMAAARLGFKTHVFEPGANPPAQDVCHQVTTAPYTDVAALEKFAKSVDLITFEFENVPADALDLLETLRPVLPQRRALATSQDRIVEKEFLSDLGIDVAPFANVENSDDLARAVERVGAPSILKTRRFGYDGKGQYRLKSRDQAQQAWSELGQEPCVLEGFVDFSHEVSVIGARSQSGEVVCYDPGQNVHKNGILDTTTAPAKMVGSQRMDAVLLTGKILNALDYVGVMGVELFVTPKGLIVNEIAPRVHNSGHWTQDGCAIDQFEQHIRAVAGWPLGDGSRHSNVLMTNLIGEDIFALEDAAQDPDVCIHLYGKAEAKAGRKMGHTNKISPRTN
ncbi:N5-carboxyaminoimidazole ribonucleotide synthase [Amylibacter marinus]|uniref:N5-carboxyaminoimidazole ribonucleotide synthase n=1 Tax=Amylibacter marinus TaxID=1475483 RepID=A0ABQ5VY88_9RHOB|nr:5-(carboxyamino)imidazole ribonucleotide synthase [Amylibacter marinus]GLQ36056.1 N5-carboxyaminoimidazole ribonucleotide synthase [Amylibacter marinus]